MRVRSTLVAALTVLLVGCAPGPTDPASSAGSTTSATPLRPTSPGLDRGEVQRVTQQALDQLAVAVRTEDRDRYLAQLDPQDAALRSRAETWYANLTGLPLSRFELRLDGIVGTTGRWEGQVGIRWQLRGDPGPAEHRVRLAFRRVGDRVLLTAAALTAGDPEPIWWSGPVRAWAGERVTAVTAAGQPPDRWRTPADRAAREVARRLPAVLRPGWDGRLVVEVPADAAAFARATGGTSTALAAVAARTQPAGGKPGGPLRIVVNPLATARASSETLQLLLTHEAVHVATRAPESAAPLWLTEGLADHVAVRAQPGQRDAVAAPLLTQLRAGRLPADLPSDTLLSADSPDLAAAYAQAWSVCRYVADHWSEDHLTRLYRAADRDRSLDEVAREVLEVSEAELVAGWRADLAELAGG